jgi:hypothetical protein
LAAEQRHPIVRDQAWDFREWIVGNEIGWRRMGIARVLIDPTIQAANDRARHNLPDVRAGR